MGAGGVIRRLQILGTLRDLPHQRHGKVLQCIVSSETMRRQWKGAAGQATGFRPKAPPAPEWGGASGPSTRWTVAHRGRSGHRRKETWRQGGAPEYTRGVRAASLLALSWLTGVSVAHAADPGAHDLAVPVQKPPPVNVRYLNTGVGLSGEIIPPALAADVCPRGAETPCILGSGVGLALRVGYRSRGPWYFGGAYQVSRHDASNLLRLAIMQQLRAEVRHYFDSGTRLTPYASVGMGAAAYGNEFGLETGGLCGLLAAGGEFQVSRGTAVGIGLAYRPFFLRGWTDGAGQQRADHYAGFGLAHAIALEATFETRKALSRW